VTTTATKPAPAAAPAPRSRTLTDRYLAAFPLATTYLWLLVLYGWQAERHPTPWVFFDEIKFTRIARGIADHLHPVVMGQSTSLDSLATVLTAPAWLFGSVGEGYAVAKWIGVACMAATLFPAYALARMVVGRWSALLAATGAVVAPCLAYTIFLVEEPFAYPFSTLCLFLIAKALVTRRRNWVAAAVVASLVAPFVRNQLLVLPAVFLIAASVLWWQTPAMRSRRAAWSRWDWVGLIVLALGAWILFNAVLGGHDTAWHDATGYEKRWLFLHAIDAFGALSIGLGVFPVVAAAVAFSPGKGWLTRAEERVIATLTASAVFCFVFYAGVKGAYLRANFGDIVVERNVIYLVPLLFTGLALFIARPRFNAWTIGVAAVVGGYVLLHTPTLMDKHYSYDTTGVQILQALNRWVSLTTGGARVLLVVMLVLSLEAVLLVRTARPVIARTVIGGLSVLTLAWCLTGEIAFVNATTAWSQALVRNMDNPRNWIDNLTGGKAVAFLGTGLSVPTSSAPSDTLYEAEFWNRSIVRQWSLDGSAPPPTLTPNVDARGYLLGSDYKEVDPKIDYYLTTDDIDLDGEQLAGPQSSFIPVNGYKLWKIKHPARLAHTTRGLTADGWAASPDGKQPATATYSQYATPGYRDGYLSVHFSRLGACAKVLPVEHALVKVGTLVVNADNVPSIGKVLHTQRIAVPTCGDQTVLVSLPGGKGFKAPFGATVSMTPTYRLHDYDPRSPETRWLASQVSFAFEGYTPSE
jgi:hypothetical protein